MFLAHVLGIADLELHYINALLDVIADDQFGYKVRKKLTYQPLGQVNSDTLIFFIFRRINQDVFSQVQKQLEKDRITVSHEAEKEHLFNRCEKRMALFTPNMNTVDSYFNNELDEVMVIGNTLDQIGDEVTSILLKKIRHAAYAD